MIKICILIRVYDRLADLEANLKIIRETWNLNQYYIVVVSNGKSNGFNLSIDINNNADKIVELEENVGHLKGNSQLLLNGINHIPKDCEYTILLEADTWVYTDDIVAKYILKLQNQEAVWASARWYDRCYSMATDFAIVKSNFLQSNRDILNFTNLPECWVANYLINSKNKYIYIRENMPVFVPSYIKRYFYAPKGRFYVYPYSRMVTHHIEDLKNGMDEKKFYFNVLAQQDYFKLKNKSLKSWELMKIKICILLTYLFLRRSWYSKSEMFEVSNL